ncbi:MAG: hypothetical protein ABFS86_10840 [Planctomycetota bacterium]
MGIAQIIFLACLALCFWKRLWIALAVLVGVIVSANALFYLAHSPGLALVIAFGGVLIGFPIAVYLNLEGREKQERRRTIRRSRRHTGRE